LHPAIKQAAATSAVLGLAVGALPRYERAKEIANAE
jgi:hypothetical protein